MTVDAIETDRLTKDYRHGARGVRELTLSVPTGSVFGFLGPNGAGKTTTIRVLMDLLRPTAGAARVLGLDSRADAVEIHRRTGYLPGDPALHEQLSAGELLRWYARLRGGAGAGAIEPLAERFQLDLHRPIRSLSRGNRQKVALIQAVAHEPELMILDEPTSGLDPIMQHEFALLVREATAQGRTVFLSSHVLDEVQHVCDHVGIIRDGHLVAVEAVADLEARALRHVTIRFAVPVDPAPFAALPGVSGVEVRGPVLRAQLRGAADALVKLAARFDVVDLTSEPADLEELFLAFYRDGAS